MNLNHLSYFRVLAKLEHYTQAANELAITQPTLSHAISALENELGTYLFEKQGRNVKLTKNGKIYYEYVEKALSELEKGEKRIRELTDISTGTIELGYIYTQGASLVPSLIKEFTNINKYKGIKFSFGQGTTKALLQDLKEEKYDIVFSSYLEDENEIDFTPITKEEIVLIVAKDHPLANREQINLKDIEEYPLISFSNKSGIRKVIDDILDKSEVIPNIKCEVEEDNAVAALVEINYGIALVPNISALKFYDVKILSIDEKLKERFIYMATLRNKYMTPSAKAFMKFTKDFCTADSNKILK